MNAICTIGLGVAFSLLILSAIRYCAERKFRPLRRNARRFRKLTWFEKLFFSVFVGVMTLFASIKDNPTNSPPTPFYATGPHRIYTILADPVAPWSSDPNSSQCAWTNALEWACTHTQGSLTCNEVASNVVDAIFTSGRFSYDIDNGGTFYTDGLSGEVQGRTHKVQLMACIEVLNGGLGLGKLVNCTDCAAFVTSFSNLLGCELYSSRMGYDFFTNPYCAIGCATWTAPSWGWGFSYHEVAWGGTCGDYDCVYDACLRYDGDDSPSLTPHNQLSIGGVIFSDGNPDQPLVYRERLCPITLKGYYDCVSRPLTKIRRSLR